MATLAVFRRELGPQIGPYAVQVTSDEAIGLDPGRWIINRHASSPAARVDGAPVTFWDGAWASVVTGAQAGQARRVVGSVPSLGALVASAPFGGTLAVGVEVEVGAWPVKRQHDRVGVNDLINMAIRHLSYRDEVPLTVTLATEYALTTWVNWLTQERLLDVLIASPVTDYPPIPLRVPAWEYVQNAELPKLRLSAPLTAATGTLTLVVRRPADTWIRASGGSWAETAPGVGLSAEGDEAKAHIPDVVLVGRLFAHRVQAETAPTAEERERHRGIANDLLAECRQLEAWDTTRDVTELPASLERAA